MRKMRGQREQAAMARELQREKMYAPPCPNVFPHFLPPPLCLPPSSTSSPSLLSLPPLPPLSPYPTLPLPPCLSPFPSPLLPLSLSPSLSPLLPPSLPFSLPLSPSPTPLPGPSLHSHHCVPTYPSHIDLAHQRYRTALLRKCFTVWEVWSKTNRLDRRVKEEKHICQEKMAALLKAVSQPSAEKPADCGCVCVMCRCVWV